MVSRTSDSRFDDSGNRTLLDSAKFYTQSPLSQNSASPIFKRDPCKNSNGTKNCLHKGSCPIQQFLQKSILISLPTLHAIQLLNQLTSAPQGPKVIRKFHHHKKDFDLLNGVEGQRDETLISSYLNERTMHHTGSSFVKNLQTHSLKSVQLNISHYFTPRSPIGFRPTNYGSSHPINPHMILFSISQEGTLNFFDLIYNNSWRFVKREQKHRNCIQDQF